MTPGSADASPRPLRLLPFGDDRQVVAARAEAAGLEVVSRDADVVLCHGGDGTLLRAERRYPEVPKVPVRLGRSTQPCPRHGLDDVLSRLIAGGLLREELTRLVLTVGRARFHALNDIVLRNENPALAVRFLLTVDGGEPVEYAGDGLVVATPFGSTGYYRSITRSSFGAGLGLAFNNATRPTAARVLSGQARLAVEVVRGPAVLVHDNDTRTLVLREGHRFEIERADRPAVVLGLDALRCQECRRSDDQTFNPH